MVSISKFLSYVLRHQPESIGLTLDAEGWARIDLLIEKAAKAGKQISRETIAEVVAANDKKRFALSEDGLLIRAVQGHSTNQVDRTYAQIVAPEVLYHGTATRFLESIRREGLRAGSRHYVHLSGDRETATAVGRRHGRPVVLTVAAREMHGKGFKFYRAENGVWLTEAVPREFVRE